MKLKIRMLSYPGNALAQSRALNLTLMRTLFIRAGAARYDALSLASGEAMRRRDFVISSAELKISHECRRRKFQPKIKLARNIGNVTGHQGLDS